ncbi:hypothetical protein PYW07_009512 [Mythimna separata]|uniref:Uncharacterized protein n=1 Tax=Mythimna separata TaxID=271217 RepID=A0AAD7YCP2_MYTSE|nr:hypothetical protein PYW07_009512 [Mythimna separata]
MEVNIKFGGSSRRKINKMNRLCIALLLAVVTASAVSNIEPEVPDLPLVAEPEDSELDQNGLPMETVPESRDNLNVGTIGATDRLMARTTHRAAASSFIQYDEDITIRGIEHTRITAIRVNKVGNSQNGRPSIKAGGLGFNFVTLGFQGLRNQGFEYTIDVHSSVGC